MVPREADRHLGHIPPHLVADQVHAQDVLLLQSGQKQGADPLRSPAVRAGAVLRERLVVAEDAQHLIGRGEERRQPEIVLIARDASVQGVWAGIHQGDHLVDGVDDRGAQPLLITAKQPQSRVGTVYRALDALID
jgi:hypothetical protein